MSIEKHVAQVFENYQRARHQFVQTITDLSSKSYNVETLQAAGVLLHLRPLLLDTVPSIQQMSALALGKLANHSREMADAVVKSNVLPQLVYSLAHQNKYYKRSAAFVLRTVSRHSAELAKAVVEVGGLDALLLCLEEFDPQVKESAVWALANVAKHSTELAEAVVEVGAVPLLVLCLQEPEVSLKRIVATALAEIGKHTLELAQALTDTGAIPHLVNLISNPDVKLKRQVLWALSSIVKHSVELAELSVEAEAYPTVLSLLRNQDELVCKNAAIFVRETVKHSSELAFLVVNAGGLGPVVDYLNDTGGHACLPGIMLIGYIAAHSENLAMAVIKSKGVPPLSAMLHEGPEDHMKAAAAWSLGQVGCHTPVHSRAVAETNVLPKLLELFLDPDSSCDLKEKCKRSLKMILQKCTVFPALESLLHLAPPNILKYVMAQFSKVLPHDPEARRLFVTSGGLKKVQLIKAEPGSLLQEHIHAVNSCFPEEIVRYYSPGYPEELLQRVENYQPNLVTNVLEPTVNDEDGHKIR
ncbi:sperm-associated antigen 6-like [Limulus polyphemus]|uniref:Sperm-associated antigen 6-like n=1 Tax=Limulus polyphemus TaxID=6850 RepID=A0ABM1B552_LIMPO|nr:sperm-associated antigen 6-like [Limulus polyphemus]